MFLDSLISWIVISLGNSPHLLANIEMVEDQHIVAKAEADALAVIYIFAAEKKFKNKSPNSRIFHPT